MEVKYDRETDITKVKLTRGEIREILCGGTVAEGGQKHGQIEIERIDDADTISSIGALAALTDLGKYALDQGKVFNISATRIVHLPIDVLIK